MALAAHHLPPRLARLVREPGPLPLDPAQLADHRQPDGVIRDGQRRGHPHAAVRRIDAEVQVLDGLADDLHRQAADGDLAALSIHSGSSPGSGLVEPRLERFARRPSRRRPALPHDIGGAGRWRRRLAAS